MFVRIRRNKNCASFHYLYLLVLPSVVQIYGAVTMNNTMCLGIFLAIVYFRGLIWDFSAEVSVILFATLVMGGIAAVRTTFPLWMAFIGLALYPASIALVAFLDYVCGWHWPNKWRTTHRWCASTSALIPRGCIPSLWTCYIVPLSGKRTNSCLDCIMAPTRCS